MQTIEQLKQELEMLKRELAALRKSKIVHSSDYRDYIPVHGGRIHKDVAIQYGITIRPEPLRYKIEYYERREGDFSHVSTVLEVPYCDVQDYVEALKQEGCKNFVIIIV